MTSERNAAIPTIVVVEDDVLFAEELAFALRGYGMNPEIAPNWDDALALISRVRPDLVVLDQRLGRVDTVPLLPRLRAVTTAPVLMLTANQTEADRILALEIGADDFLLKPISGRELVARIRAHLRRSSAKSPPASTPPPPPPAAAPDAAVQGWSFSATMRQLSRPDGTEVALTAAEFELLAALLETPGATIDRDTLTRRVLRRPWQADDRALDNIVLHLRRKLAPEGERVIAAVRNRGYVFTAFPKK